MDDSLAPDPWQMWDARRAAASPSPLRAVPASLPDPRTIPPREWLYGTQLIRRFVTLLIAPGGVGKSATGRGFLGETVHHAVPTWMFNLEDPLDELHRRLAAVCLLHGIRDEDLRGRLLLHSGRARALCVAAPSPDGNSIIYPDKALIVAAARRFGVGCIMVDPFVKSHRLQENSNTDMDAAATAWADVAEATGAAVQLIHHVRKPASGAAADVDAARGAKALTDAARVAMLLEPMSAAEAAQLNVPEAERWRHVKLHDAKANLAPRSGQARWFRMDSVALNNGTPAYPQGDRVAAMTAWSGEAVWRRLTPNGCNAALDRIAAGPGPGLLFAAFRRGRGGARWAGRVLMDQFEINETQAAEVIGAWLKSGLLEEAAYRDPVQRKPRLGVTVINAKRPTASRGPGEFRAANHEP